jgi:hypothetical protein
MSGFDYPPLRCTCSREVICQACLTHDDLRRRHVSQDAEVEISSRKSPYNESAMDFKPGRERVIKREKLTLDERRANVLRLMAGWMNTHTFLPLTKDLNCNVPKGLQISTVLKAFASMNLLYDACVKAGICTLAQKNVEIP